MTSPPPLEVNIPWSPQTSLVVTSARSWTGDEARKNLLAILAPRATTPADGRRAAADSDKQIHWSWQTPLVVTWRFLWTGDTSCRWDEGFCAQGRNGQHMPSQWDTYFPINSRFLGSSLPRWDEGACTQVRNGQHIPSQWDKYS